LFNQNEVCNYESADDDDDDDENFDGTLAD